MHRRHTNINLRTMLGLPLLWDIQFWFAVRLIAFQSYSPVKEALKIILWTWTYLCTPQKSSKNYYLSIHCTHLCAVQLTSMSVFGETLMSNLATNSLGTTFCWTPPSRPVRLTVVTSPSIVHVLHVLNLKKDMDTQRENMTQMASKFNNNLLPGIPSSDHNIWK